ncbi:hypothetical protein ACT4S5_04935 [Kocuria oceani]|uniref:hypothetical protein n=1 Tax=Kocuria oceani TaxID=988827 RepID=UPI0040359DBB
MPLSPATAPVPEPVQVRILGDQQLVRGGFRMLLDSPPDRLVVTESGEGADAVRAVEHLRRAGSGPRWEDRRARAADPCRGARAPVPR